MTDSVQTPDVPLLDAVQARLLGCLVEKEATTPDTYPLTVNAAQSAANQKTAREPVMNIDAGSVQHALRQLEALGLARQHFSSRADRYEHRLQAALDLTRQQTVLLALLLLGLLRDGPSMIILLMFGAYALFIGGAQVLQLVYPNEIFPTEIRAGAVGVGTSLSRIGAAVGTWLVPVSLQTLGIGTTMYIAAAITFVGLIVSWFLAPETNARSLEEAAALDDAQPRKARATGQMPKRSVLQKM